jgi:hypothetical protein
VHGKEPFDGFDLDDQLFLEHEIEAIARFQDDALVGYW